MTGIKIFSYLIVILLFTLLTSNNTSTSLNNTSASLSNTSASLSNTSASLSTILLLRSVQGIDSLKNVIATTPHDTTKIKALNDLGWTLKYSNPDTSIILGKQALALAEKLALSGDEETKDLKNKATTLSNLGAYHIIKSEYETALDYYHQSLVICESLGESPDEAIAKFGKQNIANSYNNIGIIYKKQSDYPLALDYYFKSLKIKEELGNKQGMATSYNNIGSIYYYQSDYPLALGYYFKSLKIGEAILSDSEGTPADKQAVANNYNNIGIIYRHQSDYPLALDYYFKSLKIFEELGNKQGMAAFYTNIGKLYTSIYEQGDSLEKVGKWASRNPAKLLDTAMYYQQKALNLQTELSAEYDITFSLSGIASILMQKGEYSHALEYYQQAALLADSIGALQRESEVHLLLSECYEQSGNNKLALEHYKQYSTLEDSIFNEEKSKDIGKLEARHEFEMAAMKRKRAEEEQQRILKEQTERNNLLQYSGIFIVIIAFIITLLFSGKLHIPVRLAEGGIFFTFLLIFEFMLVLIEPYVEQWTGGQPAYKLMVNAVLAALIFPFHNLAETKIKQRLFKTKKKKILATKTQRHKETQS